MTVPIPGTIRELIQNQLRKVGATGLADGEDCGCGINDLAPCEGDCMGCYPADEMVVDGQIVYRARIPYRPKEAKP